MSKSGHESDYSIGPFAPATARPPVIVLLLEAAKELKRQGGLFIHEGNLLVLVPLMKFAADGTLVKLNHVGRVWQGWRRR